MSMSNREKLEALKVWLTEHGFPFVEKYNIKNVVADLFITKPFVAVKLGDDDNFFKAVRRFANPFFIRDNESVAFVIGKMENCLKDAEEKRVAALAKKKDNEARKKEAELLAAEKRIADKERKDAEKPKRKRQRIVRAEKVV